MSKIRCSPPASHTISTVMTLGECPHTGAADGDQTCRGWQTMLRNNGYNFQRGLQTWHFTKLSRVRLLHRCRDLQQFF